MIIKQYLHHVFFILIFTVIYSFEFIHGQHIPSSERGDPNYRRKTDIDANHIRTSIFNWGITGRTGVVPDEIPYEWPVFSGKHYIALTGLFVGSLVITEEGDTLPLVTVPLGRIDANGNSMMFEPIPEYLNPNSNQIAKSEDYTTWPDCWNNRYSDPDDPGWCGSWSGYFGKNFFIEGSEIVSRFSDDHNFLKSATYYPDTTDSSRRGAGLLVDYRTVAWNLPDLEDVVFHIYSIKNDGTKNLETNSVTIWIADLVGGDGDSGDDIPYYNLDNQVVWSIDGDGIGNDAFGTDSVGIPAHLFLKTPDDNGITSIHYDPAGSIPTDQDIALWQAYMTPGEFWEPPPGGLSPGNYDLFISSGYFSLAPGEEKELIFATILSVNLDEMYDKIDRVKTFYENGFEPNPPQYAMLTMRANPDFVYSNSETSSQILLHLKDYFGNGYSDIQIDLSSDVGTVTEPVGTDSLGNTVATFTIDEFPEQGLATITANAEDSSFGLEEEQISIIVFPSEYHGDPSLPIPFDLNVMTGDQEIELSWNADYLPDTIGGSEIVFYNFNIYRNTEFLEQINGEVSINGFWSRDSVWRFTLNRYKYGLIQGTKIPADYRIEIDEPEICSSTYFYMEHINPQFSIELPTVSTNFCVKKRVRATGDDAVDWQEIPFAFGDFAGEQGILDAEPTGKRDWVIFLDDTSAEDSLHPSWVFQLRYPTYVDSIEGSVYQPSPGDTVFISTLYRFIDFEPIIGENCYQVTRFFPLDSESDLFPPGTESPPSEEACVTYGGVGWINEENKNIPTRFLLKQPYPNPFNPITNIEFFVPYSRKIKLSIYDILGRKIETILNQHFNIGWYKIRWDATDVPSGIYIVKMNGDGFIQTRKMVVLK